MPIVVSVLLPLRWLVRSRAAQHVDILALRHLYSANEFRGAAANQLDDGWCTRYHRQTCSVRCHNAPANKSLAWQGHANPRPVIPPSAGRIVAIPEVGGLHRRYNHIAA